MTTTAHPVPQTHTATVTMAPANPATNPQWTLNGTDTITAPYADLHAHLLNNGYRHPMNPETIETLVRDGGTATYGRASEPRA